MQRYPVLWAAAIAFAAIACGSSGQVEPDWAIVPGQRAGAVDTASSEGQLVLAYGADAVRTERLQLGEGETAPGTVLFPTDSMRRLEIQWADTSARARPVRLVLRGPASLWRLPDGITLGTRLRDLETRNGRAFSLAGFGWDYGGAIIDWAGGALAGELPGVMLYLDPGPDQYETPAYREVLGDREYASDMPAMQSLNPGVYQIYVDFR